MSTSFLFFSCAIFIFRKGEARRKRRRADLNTGVAGPRSEARPRFQAECSFPGGKRQPDAKEHLERGGGEQRASKVQVSPRSAPARPPLPAGLQKGGKQEGRGQSLRVGPLRPRASPSPAPLQELYTRIPAGSSSAGAPAARSHRSEPAEARAPRDVTRGAGKGRAPRPAPTSPRGGDSHAQSPRGSRRAANPGRAVPRGTPAEGRRGGSHPAAGERRERAGALVPETLRELQTLPRGAGRAPHRGSGRPRFPAARPSAPPPAQ